MTRLEDDLVRLRPLCREDADGDYPGWLNDPQVCRYTSHGAVRYTRDMALAYIDRVAGSDTDRVFAIICKETGRHIGNISLQNISHRDKSAEFAILIGETGQYNKGYATRAARLLVRYGFEELGLFRIYCGTSDRNTAMIKLAGKLGMRCEGRRVEAFFKNGEYVDILEFGILRKEYKFAHE